MCVTKSTSSPWRNSRASMRRGIGPGPRLRDEAVLVEIRASLDNEGPGPPWLPRTQAAALRVPPPAAHPRVGLALIYVMCALTAMVGLASFAVDYGRVQIAKSQLRAAADSAAMAAVASVGSITTVQDTAASFAADNNCDGTAVVIDKTNDVEFLNWDTSTRTYTVLTGAGRTTANAVRVTCKRTGSNAIPLVFGGLIGILKCNVNASAIGYFAGPGYGLVGLDFITLKGNSTASYWSATNTTGTNQGNVASNGNVTSSNNAVIQGNVWVPASATVSGVSYAARKTLPATLVYPNGDPGAYGPSNNNDNNAPPGSMSGGDINISNNKSMNFPAGTYYVNNITLGPNATMNMLGAVTIYAYGNVSIKGQVNTLSNVPGNLNLTMVPNPSTGAAPGTVDLGSSGATYANVYAPQSAITMSGNGAIYGRVIGKSIYATGSADIYYDLSLPGGGTGKVQLVQ
jgi:hypothetical protein